MIDHRAPVQGAIVIHPVRSRASTERTSAARLEEAVGLAAALDLDVRGALAPALRTVSPASLFGSGKV